jgi:hypothetical protein
MVFRETVHLDGSGPHDVALHENVAVSERFLRLSVDERETPGELGGHVHQARALAAATVNGLDEHGAVDAGGLLGEQICVLAVAVVAGYTGNVSNRVRVDVNVTGSRPPAASRTVDLRQ